MMHLAPKQLADGRWRYAAANSRGGGPIGYCADHAVEGHATADEARECYGRFVVDQAMSMLTDRPDLIPGSEDTTADRCEAPGCERWQSAALGVGGYRHVTLCPEHRTREQVERILLPVGESWES